jgi:transposase
MPWRETAPMTKHMRFVPNWERGLFSMVELWERYSVSRKTGYKWLARYEGDGADGLRERSHSGPVEV